MTVGVELCRLTVRGPRRQCDLALPASATVGELVPLLRRLTAAEAPGEPDGKQNEEPAGEPGDTRSWVLQRLGGPPLDPGDTAEKLDLRDGEVLYLNPAEAAPAELNFDDLGVGVAQAVAQRADFWRPAFTRAALLAAACVVLAAYAADAAGARPASVRAVWFAVAAAALTTAAALTARLRGDRALGIVCGLAGCAFGAAAGVTAITGPMGHRALLPAALAVAAAAGVCGFAGRLPLTLFGSLTGTALCAVAASALDGGLHWGPQKATAVLAVALFALTGHGMRIALRAARLRVPQLPHTAQELQEDLEPERASTVLRRAATAVCYADALFISSSAVCLAAIVLLARDPGWFPWSLAVALAVAVLLRAHTVAPAWQRGPLMACGALGLAAAADAALAQAGAGPRAAMALVLAAAAAGLLAASRRLPGRRLLPFWGQMADRLELWTAVALVPLLLQVFHAYSYFHLLIN